MAYYTNICRQTSVWGSHKYWYLTSIEVCMQIREPSKSYLRLLSFLRFLHAIPHRDLTVSPRVSITKYHQWHFRTSVLFVYNSITTGCFKKNARILNWLWFLNFKGVFIYGLKLFSLTYVWNKGFWGFQNIFKLLSNPSVGWEIRN